MPTPTRYTQRQQRLLDLLALVNETADQLSDEDLLALQIPVNNMVHTMHTRMTDCCLALVPTINNIYRALNK